MKRRLKIFIVFLILCGFQINLIAQKSTISTVVIDAGHGGKDPGAIGSHSREKDIALSIALKTGQYIEQYLPDVRVVYTRKTDTFIKLYERANIANKADADFFISIHCNSSTNKKAYGSETYTMGLHKSDANLKTAMLENAAILLEDDADEQYDGFNVNATESYIEMTLFQDIYQDESNLLAAYIQDQFKNRVGRRDRGVHQAGFLVLWRTAMPGVLVELGFISNPNEEKFLKSEDGQAFMASAIYRAFKAYKLEFELENKPKDITEEVVVMPSSLDYRIQFFTDRIMVSLSDPRFSGLQDLEMYEADGLYKYTSGHFSTFEEARGHLEVVRDVGFEDAFIVAFNEGKRIAISDARALEGQ
jgi:N-acetylmuramoyl-L-alanine amidase